MVVDGEVAGDFTLPCLALPAWCGEGQPNIPTLSQIACVKSS